MEIKTPQIGETYALCLRCWHYNAIQHLVAQGINRRRLACSKCGQRDFAVLVRRAVKNSEPV